MTLRHLERSVECRQLQLRTLESNRRWRPRDQDRALMFPRAPVVWSERQDPGIRTC